MGKRELVVVGLVAGLLWSCGSGGEQEPTYLNERSFQQIHSSGFTSPAGSCVGTDSSGEMRVRFVLMDNDGRPIRLGEALRGQTVELDRSSIELDGQASAFFEVNDAPVCSSDQDCTNQGFSCGVAPGLNVPEGMQDLDRCLMPEPGLTVADTPDAVDFVADTSADQVFGVLMDQSGSLEGWLPAESMRAWDSDGDGTTDTPASAQPRAGSAIATDMNAQRFAALSYMDSAWKSAAELAAEEGRQSYFGLWSFESSELQAASHVTTAGASQAWTSELQQASNAMADLTGTNVEQTRANTYETLTNLLQDQYGDEAMSQLGIANPSRVDKMLTVFVDGPDEMRERDSATLDDVIAAARQNNVRIFIVHLDAALDDPSQLRDDPMYPEGQTPCSDDSECKNYETCREVRGYADSVGAQPTLPSGASYDSSQTYCQPNRDLSGRIGPIHDYARLACETQGGYIYAPSVELLAHHMRWLPHALDGLWEAKVDSSSIQRGEVGGEQPFKLQTRMNVNAAQMARTYEFSQVGYVKDGADAHPDDFDTRAVIFTK